MNKVNTIIIIFISSLCSFSKVTGQLNLKNISKTLNKNKIAYNISIINTSAKESDSIDKENINSINNIYFQHEKLFIGIKGTGKLYELNSNQIPVRIDNTKFGGDRFGSSDFIYNDTIYSIGGYGFWNITGTIRYYNKATSEWGIFRSNYPLAFANGINANSYFDPKKGELHLIYNDYTPEYIDIPRKGETKCFYQCLNLKTKKWLEKPLIINEKLSKICSDLNFIQSTPTGVLVSSKLSSSILLIDFNKKLLYTLKDSKFTEFVQKKNKIKNGLIYSTDSSLILYDNLSDSLECVSFKKNDVTLTNINLFDRSTLQDIKWSEFLIPILILIIIVLIILFISIYKKYKKTKILIRTDQVYTLDEKKKTINDFIKNLSEIEIQILEVLVRNNWNFMSTSAAEINKKLGTEKKDTKIQNNIRGEVLSNINNKFSVYSSIKEDLINRKKMDFDKRHVEYYVNENLIKKFPKKIFD
jgi:hypothetical protein